MKMGDIETLTKAIAAQLTDAAPPKIEGGSDARRQWIADILAIQMAFGEIGEMARFVSAMAEGDSVEG